MTEPFGIDCKFNILHKTGKGINIRIMRETSKYLELCTLIILNDPENQFNREAQKCAAKLFRQSRKVSQKADELLTEASIHG